MHPRVFKPLHANSCKSGLLHQKKQSLGQGEINACIADSLMSIDFFTALGIMREKIKKM